MLDVADEVAVELVGARCEHADVEGEALLLLHALCAIRQWLDDDAGFRCC